MRSVNGSRRRHPRWMRRICLAALMAGLVSLVGGWFALGAAGQDSPRPAHRAPALEAAALPPLPPHTRGRVVQPQVANAPGAAAETTSDAGLSGTDKKPAAPASAAVRGAHPGGGGANAVSHAVALGNGVALPPLEAPEAVKQIIEAGNG